MTPLTTTSTSNLNSVVIAANGLGYVVGSVGESLLIGTNGAVASGQLAIGTTTMNSICATTGGDFVVGGNKATVNAVAGLWDGNKRPQRKWSLVPLFQETFMRRCAAAPITTRLAMVASLSVDPAQPDKTTHG